MKFVVAILTIALFLFIGNVAIAYEFYGASVADKDAPTAAWKVGMRGIYPIIDEVTPDSPAERAGFAKGDIILSINNKDVKRSSDLDIFKDNTLKVSIYSGFKWRTLIVDRIAIEADKVKRISAAEAATVTSNQSPYIDTGTDNSPPVHFDDAALENKFGKTSPSELARQKQIAEDASRRYDAEALRKIKEENDRKDAIKLAKTDCEGGIPGECGTGRFCVYADFLGKPIKGSGTCHLAADADRIVSETNQQRRDLRQQQHDATLERKLDDIRNKADRIDRQLKWGW